MQTKLTGAHKILPHLLTVVEAFKIVLPLLGALDGVLALRHALGEVHPDRITATDLRDQSVPASGIVRYANLAFLDQRSTAGVVRGRVGRVTNLALRAPAGCHDCESEGGSGEGFGFVCSRGPFGRRSIY